MNISFICQRSYLFFGLLLANPVFADDVPKKTGQPAGKTLSVSGLFLSKDSSGTWKSVKAGDALPSGSLLLGIPRVEFTSLSGEVQVRLLADIGNRGPFPVLESAVVLHDAAGVDLDLTFERGLMVLENLKKEGGAKVRLRIGDESWVLSLQTPGTKVGLEIFGRHPAGLPKVKDENKDTPTIDVLMLVLNGQAFLDTGKEGMGMHSPPGLARFHWDNALRQHTFQRLDKLPESIVKPLDDRETILFKELCADTLKLAQGDLGTGLDQLLQSENKVDRLVGLTIAGGTDDLTRVFATLMNSKDQATRDQAILVLRHWLGREPGQLKKLHAKLLENKKLTEVQARNLMHLLLGFNAQERSDPDTFIVLLGYLDHKNQAVRALAHWHLLRLAPAGKNIPFDPAGPEVERLQAVQRWHALIPDGQLPPKS